MLWRLIEIKQICTEKSLKAMSVAHTPNHRSHFFELLLSTTKLILAPIQIPAPGLQTRVTRERNQ